MTTKQADKIINAAKPVTVTNSHFGETFTALFVRRDRYRIYTDTGAVYERDELELLADDSPVSSRPQYRPERPDYESERRAEMRMENYGGGFQG